MTELYKDPQTHAFVLADDALASSSHTAAAEAAAPEFEPASAFNGKRQGYVFRSDHYGLGYYRDVRRPAPRRGGARGATDPPPSEWRQLAPPKAIVSFSRAYLIPPRWSRPKKLPPSRSQRRRRRRSSERTSSRARYETCRRDTPEIRASDAATVVAEISPRSRVAAYEM